MIATIIEGLDLAASEVLTVAQSNGLAELVPDVGPAIYNGTDWTPIGNDNAGTFSYWRLNGQIREQAEESTTTCSNVFRATYPLRYVAMVDRDGCGGIEAARAAATAIRGTERDIRTALGANLVELRSVSVNVDSVAISRQEGLPPIEPNKAFVSIDVQLVVVGRAACFDPCENGGSFLCRIIEAQSWARIKACMSEAQIDAATDDLCEGGGPCEPLGYDLHNSLDEVLLSGVVLEPCGATLEIPAPDATLTWKGTPLTTIPSGNTLDIGCNTPVDAVRVTASDNFTDLNVYALTGTNEGRGVYEDVNGSGKTFIYNGTEWVAFLETNWVAAPGNEQYPWEADWSETGIAVEQVTIGTYCEPAPCLLDITVNVDGVEVETLGGVDPCEAQVLNINITYS